MLNNLIESCNKHLNKISFLDKENNIIKTSLNDREYANEIIARSEEKYIIQNDKTNDVSNGIQIEDNTINGVLIPFFKNLHL